MHRELPVGCEPWLEDFVREVEQETTLLRENGALPQVAAREAVLAKLVKHATAYFDSEIGTKEAAEILQVDEETVRRKVRAGIIPAERSSRRGHHRIKRGNVHALAGGRKTYNVFADAQEVARLRQGAA